MISTDLYGTNAAQYSPIPPYTAPHVWPLTLFDDGLRRGDGVYSTPPQYYHQIKVRVIFVYFAISSM